METPKSRRQALKTKGYTVCMRLLRLLFIPRRRRAVDVKANAAAAAAPGCLQRANKKHEGRVGRVRRPASMRTTPSPQPRSHSTSYSRCHLCQTQRLQPQNGCLCVVGLGLSFSPSLSEQLGRHEKARCSGAIFWWGPEPGWHVL